MAVDQAQPTFARVADGVHAQVVRRAGVLPAHLDRSAHEGRAASCRCRPLLDQLQLVQSWAVVPQGTREACTQEEHELVPLRLCTWPSAPPAIRLQALHQRVDLTLTMCRYCGAIEVRDVSFHAPAGLQPGINIPRRRSDLLGWYAGRRPGGRIYV